MRIKTNLKAGGTTYQHNQTIRSLKIKSGVKAGGLKEPGKLEFPA